MNYRMTKEVIDLLEKFEKENDKQYYTADINGFKEWVCDRTSSGNSQIDEPYWEGKEKEDLLKALLLLYCYI